MNRRTAALILATTTMVALCGCGSRELDAGSVRPHGLLPVDERNPIILCNDGTRDGWQGEYATALAAAGKLKLAGMIVNTSSSYPSLQTNVQSWQDMVKAARASGMGALPDPIGSVAPPLLRPASGNIDDTVSNGSEGSHLILEVARREGQPLQPVVIATGGGLTEVADAYLQDHAITDRVVVVAKLGTASSDGRGAVLGNPNGVVDPWADEIVIRRFRYVQVNTTYTQTGDITANFLATLPASPFIVWMGSKLPLPIATAVDQVSVFAAALTGFSVEVVRMSVSSPTPSTVGASPVLTADPSGDAWAVNTADSSLATSVIRQALAAPSTYQH